MYFDTHTHLLDNSFQKDLEQVLLRAKENKINYFIEIGFSPILWKRAIDLSFFNPDIFCAIGVHPNDAQFLTQNYAQKLEELVLSPHVVGIGETGLDYYHMSSSKEIQKGVFKFHIYIAHKVGKPLIIHCRQAYQDLIEILEEESKNIKGYPGVIHCFSGNVEEAKRLIEMGFFIGIDGPITYDNSTQLRLVVSEISLDNIVLETDCPYLAPQQYRGKRNEPSYLPLIAEEIAKIKSVSLEYVANKTTENAKKLFNIK